MNEWEKAVQEATAEIREAFVHLSATTSRHGHEETLERLARKVMNLVPDPLEDLAECTGCPGLFPPEEMVAGPTNPADGLPVWVMCEQCHENWDGE